MSSLTSSKSNAKCKSWCWVVQAYSSVLQKTWHCLSLQMEQGMELFVDLHVCVPVLLLSRSHVIPGDSKELFIWPLFSSLCQYHQKRCVKQNTLWTSCCSGQLWGKMLWWGDCTTLVFWGLAASLGCDAFASQTHREWENEGSKMDYGSSGITQ